MILKTYFYYSPNDYHRQPPVNERTLSNDSSADSTYRLMLLYKLTTLIRFDRIHTIAV